jgi:phosphoglycolate phosphatase
VNGNRPFDLLIFDWDGTLADSEAVIVGSMQGAITALDLPPRTNQQIRELIGLGLNEALQALYPELVQADLLRLLAGYRDRFLATGIKEAPLFEGALEALKRLHGEGYRLAIATGKSRKGLDRSLREHADLKALISSSRCADETASKPNPLMLQELLEEEALPAPRTLMIGDTEYDVAMAQALSIPALGVVCGVHDPGRLLEAGAVALIDAVHHLPQWLVAYGTKKAA